jgi:hypothetical protein
MVVEHIVPLVAGGTSDDDNLCLSCYRCNEFKGPRRTATDPQSGQEAELFHPRQQRWTDHFAWDNDGLRVVGLTSNERATVSLLRLNNDWLCQARRVWRSLELHLPREE